MQTLKLAPGAFNEELSAIIGINKVGYTGEDHDKLVDRLLARLVDQEGNPYQPAEETKNILRLLFRPTTELQAKVLKQAFAAEETELEAAAEGAFGLLFNVAQFGEYLKKKVNPKTKMPFIAKPPSRAKKKTLDDLVAEEPATDKAEEPSVENETPVQPEQNDGKKSSGRK